jgi:hypothetical protein
MKKPKRKLTPAQRAAKKRRRQDYMMVFVHGKQKWIKRPPTIDGIDADEFIRENADPIWLVQNEMWEYLEPYGNDEPPKPEPTASPQGTLRDASDDDDEEIPF